VSLKFDPHGYSIAHSAIGVRFHLNCHNQRRQMMAYYCS
jgi:hypothetical protein